MMEENNTADTTNENENRNENVNEENPIIKKNSSEGMYDLNMSSHSSPGRTQENDAHENNNNNENNENNDNEMSLLSNRSPRKSLKNDDPVPNLNLDQQQPQQQLSSSSSPRHEIGNLAATSPREVVQVAVNNFCEDTFALVEDRVHKQRKKSTDLSKSNSLKLPSPIPSKSSSPRPQPVPQDLLQRAVSSFCEDTIATAESGALKVLSPRPPPPESPSNRHKKKEELGGQVKKNSQKKSPKANLDEKNKPKGKSEKRSQGGTDVSPTRQQPSLKQQSSSTTSQNESDTPALSVVKGEKISRIAPPKKMKKKIDPSHPSASSSSSSSLQSAHLHGSAPVSTNENEVIAGGLEEPQTTGSSVNPPPLHPIKGNKDPKKRSKEKKKMTKGLSPSPSGDGAPMFPPINRPSPPSSERNVNQQENPRNRKLSKFSSKEEGKSEIESEGGSGGGSEKDKEGRSHLPHVNPKPRREKQQSKSVPNNRVIDSNEDGLLIHRETSRSAQMDDQQTTLPPIKGIQRSETTPRTKKRKKPLFLRLEDKAKKIQMEIEREKLEMYHKIKIKKIQSQPTKEEIEQHILHYQQLKAHQLEHEKELAEARKKDWKAHEPKYSKFISPKKLDFIEELKAREKEEEEARKIRLEKAKEFNSALKVGGSLSVGGSPEKIQLSPNHHHMEVVGMSPRLQSKEDLEGGGGGVGGELKILVPDSSRQHLQTPPRSTKQKSKHNGVTPGRESNHPHPSPSLNHNQQPHPQQQPQPQQKLSPNQMKKKANPKRLISQSSSVVENIGSPYDGKIGPDWVSEVMEMDEDETVLADVYETGFSMLMVEKGLISRDPDDENNELVPAE